MPVLGFREGAAGWALPCSLSLASCRLRAEALARQLNSGLWAPRSPGDSGCVSPVVVERAPRPATPPKCRDLVVFGAYKEECQSWRPDSPPESSTSESPALTIEVDSAETLSELASPTYSPAHPEEGGPLADELRNRLRLIQSQKEELEEEEEPSQSSTISSSSVASKDLLSPEACPRLVRSTSLKTGKTPPDTPSRKKIVRFADVLGLDLEAVRHFAKDDDAPFVPQSAFADLAGSAPKWASPESSVPGRELEPQFDQPGCDPRFLDRVRQQRACLEDAVVRGTQLTGVVRVLNLGFEKLVQVRWTTSEWAEHADLEAEYVQGSCDGFSDRFRFRLDLRDLTPGQRALFAIRYVANGQEFWDNNRGENYSLRCQEGGAQTGSSPLSHHFL